MSETAAHRTADLEAPLKAVNALSMLDLGKLSFTQLRRLHKSLEQALADVAAESERRADGDNSGDTVKVPSPAL